jgi:hypothetical protein
MVLENGAPKPTPGFGDWGVAGLIGFELHVSRETLGQIAGREGKGGRRTQGQGVGQSKTWPGVGVSRMAPFRTLHRPASWPTLALPLSIAVGWAVGSSRCHARFRILARFGLLSLTQCKCRLTLGAPTSAAIL